MRYTAEMGTDAPFAVAGETAMAALVVVYLTPEEAARVQAGEQIRFAPFLGAPAKKED